MLSSLKGHTLARVTGQSVMDNISEEALREMSAAPVTEKGALGARPHPWDNHSTARFLSCALADK